MSQANNKALDSQTETRVVAMIARGDKYEQIQQTLEREGSPLAIGTISAIKKRNSEALAFMKRAMLEQQATQATKILAKSRNLIEDKLDRANRIEERLIELAEMYHNEEIDDKEYNFEASRILNDALSIAELNSVSKEAFNQSQIEAGKPTRIAENPQEAKETLGHLLENIKENNEVELQRIIFNPKDNAIPNTV